MNKSIVSLLSLFAFLVAGCSGGGTGGGDGSGGGQGTGPVTSAGENSGYMPEGAVTPNPESIESGEYKPLSRPLFLYVNTAALKRPEVVAFLEYYVSEAGQELVSEVGYVKLSDESFQKAKKTLTDAIAASGTTVSGDLAGEIKIDGSSTVYPVSQAVTEDFSAKHRQVKAVVAKSGTSGGMKRFVVGEIDIADASRAIKDTEIEACKSNGIDFIELKIGIDGLTVVVNSENDWVAGLTVAELKKIWEPGSQVKKWSEINPDFPDQPIVLYGADTDSGTFEYFTEEICGSVGASRSDYNQSPDDNFLVTGVSGDKFALGYFGYAYYIENQEALKPLAIAP